jgi:8-oxo-dGTP pyrophosphatase MutT (NUDIX family)
MALVRGMTHQDVDHIVEGFNAVVRKSMRRVFAQVTHDVKLSSHVLVAAGPADAPPPAEQQYLPGYAAMDALSVIQTEWAQSVNDEIVPYLAKVYLQSAATVSVGVKDAFPQLENETFPQVSNEYALAHLADARNRVQAFSNDMWNTAREQLVVGLQEGESVQALANRIAMTTSIKEKKAHVIAQTEVIAAVNGGEWQQMLDIASAFDMVTMKEWEATEDSHTRPTHWAADGQRVLLEAKFAVGASLLDYPGDPHGSPSETISCRCTTLYDTDMSEPTTVQANTSIQATGDPLKSIETSPETLSTLSAVVAKGGFDPLKHPRGNDGKFIEKGHIGGTLYDLISDINVRYHDLDTVSKDAMVFDAKQIDQKTWNNLKSEQRDTITKSLTKALDEGIPGSAGAVSHLENLDDNADDIVRDTKSDDEVFSPDVDIDIPDTQDVKETDTTAKTTTSPFQILDDTGENGDGYAAPGLWGKYGAAGVMIRNVDENGTERFLMVQRGPMVSSNKGKWQLAGGALNSKETPEQGAAREIFEEIGAPKEYLDTMVPVGTHAVSVPIAGKKPWVYSNIAADAPTMFYPKVDGTETGDAKWLTHGEIQTLEDDGKLHPAIVKNLGHILKLFDDKDIEESKKLAAAKLAAPDSEPATPDMSKSVLTPEDIMKQWHKGLIITDEKDQLLVNAGGIAAVPTPTIAIKEVKLPTTGSPKAIKITHGLIHAKHTPGTTIAQTSDGKVKVTWNGKEYDVTFTKGGPTETIKKSGLYAYLAKNFPNEKWSEPGNVAVPVSAPSVAAVKPALNPIPKPVAKALNADVIDMSGWKQVGDQKGSNKGGLFVDPTGKQWYVKSLKSEDHAKSEVLAAALYHAAGIDVPEVRRGDNASTGWKNVVVSPIVPNSSSAAGKLSNDVVFKAKVQGGFAVDAWLANHDVVGLSLDNILDANGQPWRIDVGGSLRYRAQGGKKPNFDGDPSTELAGLLSDSKNPQAAQVFGGMSTGAQRESAKRLLPLTEPKIRQLVKDNGGDDSLADILVARRANILDKYGLNDNNTKSNATLTNPAPATLLSPTATPNVDVNAPVIDTDGIMLPDQVDATVKYLNGGAKLGNKQTVAVSFVNTMTEEQWNSLSKSDRGYLSTLVDGASYNMVGDKSVTDAMVRIDTWKYNAKLAQVDLNAPKATLPSKASTQSLSHGVTDMGLSLALDPDPTTTTAQQQKFATDWVNYSTKSDWDKLNTDQKAAVKKLVDDAEQAYVLNAFHAQELMDEWINSINWPAPIKAPPPPPPSASSPTGIAHLDYMTKASLYTDFKAEKVSPAWSGAKIYASLQAAKAKNASNPLVANLTDAQLLAVMDEKHAYLKYGNSKTAYTDKVTDWLKTPNGKKAAIAAKSGSTSYAPSTSYTPPVKGIKKLAGKKFTSTGVLTSSQLAKKDISNFTVDQKDKIYTSFKSGAGEGTSVKHKEVEIFTHANDIANKEGLSLGELLAIVDDRTQAKYGKVSTTYTEKINDWVAKINGKKTAEEILNGTYVLPAPKISKSASPSLSTYGSSLAANLPYDQKVPQLHGSQKWDVNKPHTDFPIVSGSYAKTWQNAQTPWTAGQRASLKWYTGGSYSSVNSWLRGQQSASSPVATHAKNMQNGMRPSEKDILLHRGNGWFTGWSSVAEAKSHVGKTMHQKGFFSTSVGGTEAFSNKNITFVIEAPKGTPMAYVDHISSNKGENEMLLAAGLRYKVISVKDKSMYYGGGVTVLLRVIAEDDES